MATFRYIKWTITARRASANSIQVSEFRVRNSGSPVAWNGSAVATNPAGNNPPGELPQYAIDGDTTSTKWLDFYFGTNGQSVLEVDNTTDISFDSYEWFTANDSDERDPISWTVHGSANGTDWTLLDTRSGETITTSRNVSAGIFTITEPSSSGLRTIGRGIIKGIVR